VDDEHAELRIEGVPKAVCVLLRHRGAHDHVAQEWALFFGELLVIHHREREHIRRMIVAGEMRVQLAHVFGGDEQDR
jgi:hypothetical protein